MESKDKVKESKDKVNQPGTWDEIESLDDIILPEEEKLIRELEGEVGSDPTRIKCPHLGKKGESFYYCKVYRSQYGDENEGKLGPRNPFYNSKVGVAEMDLYCLGSPEKCFFKNNNKSYVLSQK